MWSYPKVKETFLNYFIKNKHVPAKESSLLHSHNDSSTKYTSSSLVPFSSVILGSSKINVNRICVIQKCIRADSILDDFDISGKDTSHHTMFEMASAISFNYQSNKEYNNENDPYYKSLAVNYMFDLLINIYGIDKSRLYVTYFKGNSSVPVDTESKSLLEKHISDKQVLSDNNTEFVTFDKSGICGISCGIYYDLHGGQTNITNLLKIGSVIFVEYNKKSDNTLSLLQNKCASINIGIERLCTVLQNKKTTYETDIYQPIIDAIYSITNVDSNSSNDISLTYRILADHMRTFIYLLSNDIIPTDQKCLESKLFRRANHLACQFLHTNNTIMSKLGNYVIEMQGKYNKNILNKKNLIQYVINNEEIKNSSDIWKSVIVINRIMPVKNKKFNKRSANAFKSLGIPDDILAQFTKDTNLRLQIN